MTDAELLAAVRATLALEVTPTVNAVTVGQAYIRWKATKPRGRPWQMVRALLRPFVLAFWRLPCCEMTAERYDAFRVARRRQRTRTGRPPKESTVNLELVRARELLAFAVETGLVARNPIAKVRKLACRRGRETWLTMEQVDRLLAAAWALGDHRRICLFRALVIAMVETGMRIGEAIRVRRDRISISGAYQLGAEHTKTRRRRTVAFTARALEAFDAVSPVPGSPYVFASVRAAGRTYDLSAPRDWFRTVVEQAGLDAAVADGDFRLRPHDLRHSAASIADARGARATAIQRMLGHASLATTQRYLHRDAEEDAVSIARIMERRGPVRSPKKDLDARAGARA